MTRRARRIALLTVAAGCLVVAGLVAFNWQMVRDHAEAWWFVCSRGTKEIHRGQQAAIDMPSLLWHLAEEGRRPVIYDPVAWEAASLPQTIPWEVLRKLRQVGYRIIEQRFPQRAYVVVGYPARAPLAPDEILRVQKESRALMQRALQQVKQRALESRSLKYPAPPRKAFEKDA